MNNAQGKLDSALVVYGGLVTEVNPSDLPAGAAPICSDMDFSIGSVKSRDGLQNVYSYCNGMESCLASNLTDGGGSGQPWSGGSVTVNQNSPANVVNSVNALGAQGSGTGSFTVTITAGASGIKVGDLAFLLVQSHNATVFYPYVNSVTDSLGNTWNLPTGGSGVAEFKSNTVLVDDVVSLCSAPMLTAVAPGHTFTITFACIGTGTLTINDGVFLNLTGVTYTGNGITVFATGGGVTTNTTTFNSGSTSNHNDWFIAICYPLGAPITVIPSGFTTIGGFTTRFQAAFYQNTTAATVADQWTQTTSNGWATFFVGFAGIGGPQIPTSNPLAASTFPCLVSSPIPTDDSILGVQIQVTGSQTSIEAGANLTLTANSATIGTFQLPVAGGTYTVGSSTNNLGLTSASFFNLFPVFDLTATAPTAVTFHITSFRVTIWYAAAGPVNFNYVKTLALQNGGVYTIALDSGGTFWQEDIVNNPDVLCPFFLEIEPNPFADSVTEDDREFIALSDLQFGTDMPRQYNGQWVDRVSQVGPGAPPAISTTSTVYGVSTITQPGPVSIGGTPHGGVQWTSSVNGHTPGNLLIVYQDASTNFLAGISVGTIVYLQFTASALLPANGTYIVTGTGTALGMESGDGENFAYFTVVAPSTAQLNVYNNSTPVGTYEITLATLTMAVSVPNVQVGSQITLTGVTPGGWDNTWTVTATPNSAQIKITQTSLTTDVATYDYTLITGVAPVAGQLITITGCTNGPIVNGTSVFNVVNATITTAGVNTFTISPINANDVSAAPEVAASGIVNGNVFQFDPGTSFVGGTGNPILGTGTGGGLVPAGNIGAGVRSCVVMFLTRNSYLTEPSPPILFETTAGASAIVATNVPLGPPNVIARYLAFTGANGAYFYYIPVPVTITDPTTGQQVTYNATVINDNTTTQVTLNFTDAVLLAGVGIDQQGNNLFEQIELGSCTGFIAYGNRLFAIGENNKVQNLLNMSFDGGYYAVSSTTPLQPLGWFLDPLPRGRGSLILSPLFGQAYYIQNLSGATQAYYGLLFQSAYQDYNKVPIINPQTQYGARITAQSPSGAASGFVTIDLFSPSFNLVYGSFSVPLASLTTGMQIFKGTLLTNAFATNNLIPADLQLRVYAQNIPNGGDVLIDRIEIYDLSQPVLSGQLRASYEGNFEAFDDVTGNLGVNFQNQQPAVTAFTLYDNLYVVKTNYLISTSDNGVTEPDMWTDREVSNRVGTPSIHGCDYGTGWALFAGQQGLYVFDGGQPIKMSPEIDDF